MSTTVNNCAPCGAFRARPSIEALEDRTALSIALPPPGEYGPVVLTGTEGADQFIVRTAPVMAPGNWLAFSDDGGQTYEIINAQYVTNVAVRGLGGNDTLTLDNSAGALGRGSEPLSIRYDGGAGFDQLVLTGNPGGSIATAVQPDSRQGDGTVKMTDGTHSVVVSYTSVESVVDQTRRQDGSPSGQPGGFRK